MSTTVPDRTAHPTELGQPGPEDYRFTRKAWIATTPSRAYDLVSDVRMIGTWSPSASEVRYDAGCGPYPGARFGGRNRRGDREWTSRSQVLEAEPGDTFSFVVEEVVRWRWTFRPLGTGTVAEQSWQLLRLDPVLGTTRAELDALLAHMADSAETTLTALARWVAEESDRRGLGHR
ncbi:polyketide cyclase/dehydrase/lipid transport protein [Streptomyces sp. 840.1]|uniref:SRPBCC family protein n=1 Tax=Streptomyces sp. 840.1 TaxID=2485152 RepID=UPI000F48D7A2|nr:SRPBCC family protein [Streptomyces sp. 840.1]ROQ66394.1 polyketide cyclase/dehydrase/lipid transport protein [Streptomyces sp. 840.1]